jgi:hypothetical protein
MLVTAEWCDNAELWKRGESNYATDGAPKGPDILKCRGTCMPVVPNERASCNSARETKTNRNEKRWPDLRLSPQVYLQLGIYIRH